MILHGRPEGLQGIMSMITSSLHADRGRFGFDLPVT